MRLYLVQHGLAETKEINRSRPLSQDGRVETERMAVLAARLDLKIQQVRHSGKLRAAQTAEIFGSALAPAEGVISVSGLNPTDEVAPVVRLLGMESLTVMLIGHLPSLSKLTGVLVNGDARSEPITFRNSSILCLARQGARWEVRWYLSPG